MTSFRNLLVPALLTAAATWGVGRRPWLEARVDPLLGTGATEGVTIMLAATAWLAAAWGGSRVLDLAVAWSGRHGQVPRLLIDLLRAFLYGMAVLAILRFVFDQPVLGLIATSGVVIAVIGFALRNIIADVFSGIALNIERPYQIGDWIEVSPGVVGRVDEINWRTTRLVTLEGTTVVVPNGLVAGSRFVNYSQPAPRFRVALSVTLDQEVPVSRAKRILLSALVCAEGVLPEPRPDVLVESVGVNGVTYQARFWVPDYGRMAACRDAAGAVILDHLARAGVQLARPKQDVRFQRSPPPAAPADGVHRSLLAKVDLFAAFRDEEIDALAAAMQAHTVPAGYVMVREGESGASLFLVVEGVLDVQVTVQSRSVLLDRMRPGDVFGEMSLLTGEPRSASVIANTDSLVYELGKEQLDPILRRRPELTSRLAELMALRRRHNEDYLHTRARAEPRDAAPPDLLARVMAFFKL